MKLVSWHSCTKTEVKEFWKQIEEILVNGEYQEIKRQKLSMRNSYYHLLTFVAELFENKEINENQLYYWNQEEAYNFFTQDKWSQWEKRNEWKRPKAKDPTTAYYRGDLLDLTLEDHALVSKLRRSRGFIFMEKAGFLQDLKLISRYGWCILAGQGFSSRELRETIMRNFPDRPIIVLHDFDIAGGMIHDVFTEGSKRTEHLDLTFENVIDLGLREIDIEELNLPKAPESKRVREKKADAWRVELNALTILSRTHNIKNPLLWYVAKRMYEEEMDLYEEAQKLHEALINHIKHQIWISIYSRATDLIREAIKLFNIEDDDITEILRSEHSNYNYFQESELKVLDQYFMEIIIREIEPILKEGEEYAKELLEKAEVDMNEFG
jgi:5S rRNA maturation endonuclease (ribonuclease M5)